MRVTLSPLASRGLAVLILLVGIGIVYAALAAPLLEDYQATRRSIEDMSAAVARYRKVADELAPRRAALAALSQRQASTAGFLQGTNDALVAAQIQNRLKAIVEAAHGELKSTQVLPVQEEGRYRRVTIRGQMVLRLPAAQRVFYDIETASPLLFLDNLNIRMGAAERRRDHGAQATSLDVRFDIYGYVRNTKTAQDRPSVAVSGERKAAASDAAKIRAASQ
ncbi:MAG: type II secretion system protein GspM [Stellaceae bacterium]